MADSKRYRVTVTIEEFKKVEDVENENSTRWTTQYATTDSIEVSDILGKALAEIEPGVDREWCWMFG